MEGIRRDRETLSSEEAEELLQTLKARFEKHPQRHPSLAWVTIQERLDARPEKLRSLAEMERTGGEPDVVGHDEEAGEFVFCDCSAESPKDRRSLCYDDAAWAARKENKPEGSAVGQAAAMGIELLDEEAYRALQRLGEFDLRTSSWLGTPDGVRALGGSIFGDRRYGRVFVFHNGADSYYASRGFRGLLRV